MHIAIYFINALSSQAEHDVTNHKSGVKQAVEPLTLTTQTSGVDQTKLKL